MSSYLSRKQFMNYVKEYLYAEMQYFDKSIFKAEQISRTIKRMGYAVNTELARIHDFDKTTERLDIVLTCNPENFDSKKRIESCLGIITRSKFVCALAALHKLKSFGTRTGMYNNKSRLNFNNGTIQYSDIRAGSFKWNSLSHIHSNLLKLIRLQAQVSKFEGSTHVNIYKRYMSETIHFDKKPIEFAFSTTQIIVNLKKIRSHGNNDPVLNLIRELFNNIGLEYIRDYNDKLYYTLENDECGPSYIPAPPKYEDFKAYIDHVFVMPRTVEEVVSSTAEIIKAKEEKSKEALPPEKLHVQIEETMAFIKADIETVNQSIQTLENELKSKRIILAGLKDDLHGFERFHPLSIRY